MARHCHEFQCTHCSGYNYPMLSDAMNGNYTLICGNPDCKHEHYRFIEDGVVTGDRHNEAADHGDTIRIMPSAFSKAQRKKGIVQSIRERVAAGLMT